MDRCGNGEIIYNHTGRWTHTNYQGRISAVGDPNRDRTATITINNLRRSDRPMFCCRVEIYKGSKFKEAWQNRHGTYMQFKDEFSVEQTDVVPAIIGEDITIPCLVHYKDPSRIDEVTWTVGSSDLCSEHNVIFEMWNEGNKSQNKGQWSVVNFPQDLSLRIKDVTSEDNKQYCCKVRMNLRNYSVASPIHGTEVVLVAESRDLTVKVLQPETTSPDIDGSATLNCSFTNQPDIVPLWIDVFWRVDSPRGPYAYHPFIELVDSNYRGRTELRGRADLHIKGVKDTDNSTYYCFVIVKNCIGNNKTISTLQYGSGTKLQVKETDDPGNNTWVYILAAVFAALIILCAVVIILKKKGIICQKRSGREDVNYLTSGIALKDENPSVQLPRATSEGSPMAQEDPGILYAHVNVTSLHPKTSNGNKGSRLDNDSQVLYAAVKPASAPQDIYSTVK
ncbi:protein turtle-like isoform X2 [Rhinoderma darwinii]